MTGSRARGRRALIWRRLVALLADGIILGLVGFVLLAIGTLLLGPAVRVEPSGSEAPAVDGIGWRMLANTVAISVLSAAYFAASWTSARSSPGQAILGIQVEDAVVAGAPLPFGRAVLRWAWMGSPLGILATAVVNEPLAFAIVTAASAVWFLTLLATALFSRSGRGLHDRLSGSLVTWRERGMGVERPDEANRRET